MQMAAPFSLYTSSSGVQLTAHSGKTLYDCLVETLLTGGMFSLSETLRTVLYLRKDRRNHQFRVLILGGTNVSWDVVLEYKRHKIVIDTAGSTQTLSQVSHTTGGISKTVDPANLVRLFLTEFSKSTELRRFFHTQKEKKVEFSIQPSCCRDSWITTKFNVCSICMNIYCPEHYKQY
jgi:hypothetical protein